MAISGQQNINIGLPNESVGSDSLYTAFTKTNVNFQTLFANASNFNTFTANSNSGLTTSSNATSGTVYFDNAGVKSLIAGTGVSLSGTTGDITISATGGNGNSGGTVTSVAIANSTRLSVTGGPIVSAGTFNIDLATSGVTSGTYAQANVTVDTYGRITAIANGTAGGTVTSVNLTAGDGVSVAGGPITSAGNITVTNTGVTRLNAGDGITLSGSNGVVTVSSESSSGTVQSVGVSSSTLTVTSTPITSIGTIGVEFSTVPVYTASTVPGSGVVGQLIAISDSTPGGKMAYYDTTNTRWSYVSDDSAV
tara:strand:+ start:512 stop:1435 length:924 start_codon:yes stop_codon:yes gene_type:complete